MEEVHMEKFCPIWAIAGAIFALSGKSGLSSWGECIEEACAWFNPEKGCCGVKIPSGKTVDVEHLAE